MWVVSRQLATICTELHLLALESVFILPDMDGPGYGYAERRQQLRDTYRFECQCERCILEEIEAATETEEHTPVAESEPEPELIGRADSIARCSEC
eukprot:SAG11_NODE_5178_length_1639_cov_0.934416_4_plen_96_part_00